MIPILFDATETAFTSNGIGRLRDCIECVVTEERNGKFECEFQYPITGKYYHDIVEGMYVYCIHDDTKVPQAFEIYARSAPMDGIVTFNARHISYKLNNIVLNPFSATTITEAFAKINGQSINANPFTFWTDKSTTANFKLLNPASARSILGGSQGSILDVYGGEYKFDMLTVRLYNRRGQDTDVTIRYGKNLKDIQQKIDNGETYDAVVPFWRQEDNVVVLDEKIVKPTSRNKQDKLFALDLSGNFQNEPTQAQLRSTAQSYVDSNKPWVPSENIKIDFIQLWQTDQYKDVAVLQRVALCDTVNVYYPALGVTAEGVKVIETQYDVLLERYEKMELGDARSSFAQTIMKKSEQALSNALKNAITRSAMEQAISHATDMITGGLGGHVVIGFNANGQPEEILIMDTDDIQTAVNVWRFNQGGLGHSHTGYNGPFSDVALTADGAINANMITVGILNAALVKAGILSDEAGKNYWNMETGEFQLASTATVGGKTVATIASDAVDAQTQQSIFNKLTNNGQTQGIYLQDGKLYINATYIKTGTLSANMISGGILQDAQGNIVWNLSTGAMTAKNLSIDSTNFDLTSSGVLTAKGANINGEIKTEYSSGGIYTHLKNGGIWLGKTSTSDVLGYIGISYYTPAADMLRVAGIDNILFLGGEEIWFGKLYSAQGSYSKGAWYADGIFHGKYGFLNSTNYDNNSVIEGIVWSSGSGIRLDGDQIVLGSGAVVSGGYRARICGNVYVDGSVTQSSDERKKDIKEYDENVDAFIQELKAIEFTWKDGADKKTHFGLGAQTTEKLLAEHGLEDAALVQHIDDNYGVNYSELAPMMIPSIQEDRKRIVELENKVASLEERIASLEALVAKLTE